MSLPLDLLPYILKPLSAPDLENCSLVAVSFRTIARPLLFSHVVLCSNTWRAKCGFHLGDPGAEYRRNIKRITLTVKGMPVFDMDVEFPPLLSSLLKTLGPQLDTFCAQSARDVYWDRLHPSFRDILVHDIMPHLRSLELLAIREIPLLTMLKDCLQLQHLHLSARDSIIGAVEDIEITNNVLSLWNVPKVASLEIDVFGEEDFGDLSSLAPYIQYAGSETRSFRLGQSCTHDFPLSWKFLEPLEDLRAALLYLSFGDQICSTIAEHSSMDSPLVLDLHLFTNLHSITFDVPVSFPSRWQSWLGCLALSIQHPHHNALEVLRFIFRDNNPPDFGSTINPFNGLAVRFDFETHVVLSNGSRGEIFAEIAAAFRHGLPSWTKAEKLKFWLGE
ncbi:hypothetical protein DL96DRAFT_1704258 [Flagelloscypha sp. PMI_526]|nr:hypothetical protein DL96DRAFT_1704258 [Flagelloscypha sp. PMI_526]